MRTIKIIGGGLAGLSLGIALRHRDVPVLIKEAGSYPRHRVCGEFISGLRDETIEALGLKSCFSDAAILREVAWYDARGQLRADQLPTPAIGLSRWTLDQRLASIFQELGGEIETSSRVDRKEKHDGQVDCAGRRPERNSEWLGLKCHVGNFREGADLEMHMSPKGYVGICRIENDAYNLCGLFRKSGLKSGSERPLIHDYLTHCGLEDLRLRIDWNSLVAESECSVAGMSYKPSQINATDLNLGDAHGLIPPFTGNGMTMAFEHAALSLDPLVRYARSQLTWEESQQIIANLSRKHFSRRLRVARGLHRMLTSQKLFRLTSNFARTPLFPFQTFYHLTR